jgi:hypothetical protein
VQARNAELDKRVESVIQDELKKPKRRQDVVGAFRSVCRLLAEKKNHGKR